MKKVLSLVLAVLMVLSFSAVAFAHNVEETNTTAENGNMTNDGDWFELGIGDLSVSSDDANPDEPGATYYITIMSYGEMITDADMLQHVTVSVAEKGDKMLKDYAIVKHNGVYKLKLTTSAFYTVDKKAADWTITFKKDGRKVAVGEFNVCQAWLNEEAFYVDSYNQLNTYVFNFTPVDLEETDDYGTDFAAGYTDDENKYAVVTIGDMTNQGTHNYAYVNIVGSDTVPDIWLDAKVTHKVKGVVLFEESAAPKEVWLANPDASDITYVTFKGDFATDYMGTMHVEADKDQFVYALADGKFVSSFTWNEDNDCWETKSNKFVDVVISDVALTSVSADTAADKENPGTGSVDFVNVAVALGVVSLAAAGAVALKK